MTKTHTPTPTREQLKRLVKWLAGVSFIGLILFSTYDIIITHLLSYAICRAEPNPETFIKHTVEYPESIYWEDIIYPGFDEKDRLLMILNYLDGVHVKAMALNAPDGTIYWYTATEDDWQTSRDIKAGKIKEDYFDTLNKEAETIAARAKKYTRKNLPPVNYSVIFNSVPLSEFESQYLWSDEIRIVDESNGEIIGFNRRLMRLWYRMLPDIALGNRYYAPEPMCGSSSYAGFDEEVFIFFKNIPFHPAHMGINRDLQRLKGSKNDG